MAITWMLNRCKEKLLGRQQAITTAPPSATVGSSVTPMKGTAAPTAPVRGIVLAGKYQLLRLLGQGGMGEVYLASDLFLNRRVAVKLLRSRQGHPGSRRRFQAEAVAASRVQHPNVLTIHDGAAPADGPAYLVMELAQGGSVRDRLGARGVFTPLEATLIALSACRGLVAVHQAGLLHRDIKPGNLLRTREGIVKVSDFGLAVSCPRDGQFAGGSTSGTAAYASPEQAWGLPLDPRSDLYSLGATYYELLTGRHPFQAGSTREMAFQHAEAPVPDPRAVDPAIPAVCAAIVRRALAKQPADRYADAGAMLGALKHAATQLETRA